MSIINESNYVEAKVYSYLGQVAHGRRTKPIYRDWWLPKYVNLDSHKNKVVLYLSPIHIPKRLRGKRLRIKIEVVKK